MMCLQVLFCSAENGRISFVRQLEPDWHIDTNPEIVFQLAVITSLLVDISMDYIRQFLYLTCKCDMFLFLCFAI